MRIHSNTITPHDLLDALEAACKRQGGSLHFATVTDHRSTKREMAYEIKLGANVKVKGDKRRRPNDGQYGAGQGWAATHDEWGEFLAFLYGVDPWMIAGEYTSELQFHKVTNYAYSD